MPKLTLVLVLGLVTLALVSATNSDPTDPDNIVPHAVHLVEVPYEVEGGAPKTQTQPLEAEPNLTVEDAEVPSEDITRQEPELAFGPAFMQSLMMIFATEIGDKTFFIAAIMAMRHRRLVVLSGALGALWVMTILSVAMGYALPQLIPRNLTHLFAALLFAYFGLKLIVSGIQMRSGGPSDELEEVERELSKDVEQANDSFLGVSSKARPDNNFKVMSDAFLLTFLAEWGDRSQIATIALAAAADPIGVIFGGCIGHAVCTGLAVVGGRLLASSISEKTVSLFGGALFVFFAFHELIWG